MGPYRAGPMEPVVHVGEQLLILDRDSYKLYGVAFIEQLPPSWPILVNVFANTTPVTTTLASGSQLSMVSTQNQLDLPYGVLAQYRARVIDDLAATIRQPQANSRFTNLDQVARLSAYGAIEDPCDHMSELFQMEQDHIFVDVINTSGFALVQARIMFYGYKYVLEGKEGVSVGAKLTPYKTFASIREAKASGEKFTVIPVGGWAR